MPNHVDRVLVWLLIGVLVYIVVGSYLDFWIGGPTAWPW